MDSVPRFKWPGIRVRVIDGDRSIDLNTGDMATVMDVHYFATVRHAKIIPDKQPDEHAADPETMAVWHKRAESVGVGYWYYPCGLLTVVRSECMFK